MALPGVGSRNVGQGQNHVWTPEPEMTFRLLGKFHWSPELLGIKTLTRRPLVVKGSLGESLKKRVERDL